MDEENRLKHVFWADGQTRRNYSIFGNVLTFDTTDETNKYFMIFAVFYWS